MRGYTLVELLIALFLASLVMLGLARVVRSSAASEAQREERDALAADARFALERMTAAVRDTTLVLVPLADDPDTGANEAAREQSIPARSGHASETAVLAVALPRTLDRNGDGNPFTILDPNPDGDANPWTGTEPHIGLLWVRVQIEGTALAFETLTSE